MPVRQLLEIRTDLIDTIVSQGFSLYEATNIADSVINPSGQIQDSPRIYARVAEMVTQMSNANPLSSAIQTLRGFFDATRLAEVVPVLPSWVTVAGLATQVDLADFTHPEHVLAAVETRRKPSGKPPMWEGGPPQPGWLVTKLVLARRSNDLLYFVSGLFGKVHLQRMPGPEPEAVRTNYKDLHREWRATDYLLCDDCRYNDLSETVCEDCAKRRLKRTGDLSWELPKFCTESFDDLIPLHPTRFEREPVI
jgi:hypothetical protein